MRAAVVNIIVAGCTVLALAVMAVVTIPLVAELLIRAVSGGGP